ESTISSFPSRSAFSSLSTPSAGSAIAPVQEAASITTGNFPLPDHSQSRSTISFALCRCAASNPFELQGNPQQVPVTSPGTQTGIPARAQTSPTAATPHRWAELSGPLCRRDDSTDGVGLFVPSAD